MKKFTLKLIVASLLATPLLALSGPYAHVFKKEVKANAKYVKYITPKELNTWITKDKDFAIIDVREPAEWQAGEIDWPEYNEYSRGLVDVMVAKGAIKPNGIYVMVCASGGRATLAGAELAKHYGFKNVYVLKGGIGGWLKAGYPIVNKLGTLKK